MSENTGGKGSKPRPIPDRKSFEDNWDLIFGPNNSEVDQPKEERQDTV